jgi:hypothetical protein
MAKPEPIIELKQGPDGVFVPDAERKHAPRTKPKTPKEPKQPDAKGRLDLLCSGAVEAVVKQSQSPVLQAAYDFLKPTVDGVFREKLGPPKGRPR